MTERVFVAIDLETTGLNARSDAIIEVGAVRVAFDRRADDFACRVLDRFVTFVNPQRPIPLRIQQLTGIRDSDVADAPTLSRVIPELLAFVRADVEAVLAHNAGFDFGFLLAAGVDFHRPVQDTFELASMLLPGMASYSLGELTRALGIPLPEAHRALDDAEAAAHLFTHLLLKLETLPPAIGHTLIACAEENSRWSPLSLFTAAQPRPEAGDLWARATPYPSGNPLAAPPVPSIPNDVWHFTPDTLLIDHGPTLQSVADTAIDAAYATEGALAQIFGDKFEPRQGQVDMAHRVLHGFNVGDHLMIEAGTGTGKSLAYLIPAALWSMTNQRRIVIATNTIALQEQLLEKDIPLLSAMLPLLGYPIPRSALLKGRSNYLCTRRLYQWYAGRRLNPLELRVLAKVLIWLLHTTTGDVSELFLPTAPERQIWARICSDSATCTPERCGVRAAPYLDFFIRARQLGERAHILVINHALLLADLAAGNRVLPPYSHLIIDEAHHLEEAATEQLSYRVDWAAAQGICQRLHPNGDLSQALLTHGLRQADDQIEAHLRRLARPCADVGNGLRAFAQALLVFAQQQENLRADFAYAQRLGLDGRARAQPAWSELEIQWDVTSQSLRSALRHFTALLSHLEARRWEQQEPTSAIYQDLHGVVDHLTTLLAWLDRIIFAEDGARERVTWLEVNETVSDVTLVAAPLFVNETLERDLLHRKRSIIFTGATLRTGSGFSFIRDRLGLWDVNVSTVDSPFDYRRSTLLYLPSDLPEPNHSHYQQAVEQAIFKAAVAGDGATLALFTSYAQLRTTAEAIRAPLDRLGITVLQHGHSSRQRLLREYRQSAKAVLLGTRSFWEGIDLPGDELRCLLIVRLPFAVPSDPLVAARSAELENPFRDYTLPDAILRFRQGFGRLIRRATDRGVVIVLDSRVWRKEYGQAFLESLPECTTRHAPLANLEAEIDTWLKRPAARIRT